MYTVFTRILFLIPSLLLISSQLVSASYMLDKEEKQRVRALFFLSEHTHGHQEKADLVLGSAEVKEVEEELKKDREKQEDSPFISESEVDFILPAFSVAYLSSLQEQPLYLRKNLQILYCSFLI